MTKIPHRVAMAGLGLSLCLAGAAAAQGYGPQGYNQNEPPSYGPPSSYGAPPPSDGYGPPPTPSPSDMARQLRQRLRLRPDQAVALNSFVQAVAPPPGMDQKMRRDQEAARAMTTPQRMDMMMSQMDEMRRIMLARVQATKAFYAQLSPDQQHAFDVMGAQDGEGGPGAYQDRAEPPGGPNSATGAGGFSRN
jgi:hypothetical protein